MTLKNELEVSIGRFISWLENYGFESFDRMDYWSSKTGKFAKKLYYKNKLVGSPLAIWGILLENILPNVQKLYSTKHREAIGDANYALGYLNLYELTNEKKYLKSAESFLEYLKKSAESNYSGKCWGYTFDWQTAYEYLPANTPAITITPYPFFAFYKYYTLTAEKDSLDICKSVSEFALNDLNETKLPNGTYSSSYTPITTDVVINANAYRANLLLHAFELTNNKKYYSAAIRNIDFIIKHQEKNGSWFYEVKPPNETFIDNFHTCFVLKNLFGCYKIVQDVEILKAIRKGYNFYKNNLIDKNYMPIHFAKVKHNKLRKYETYDFAEGILLGCLLKDIIPEAFGLSLKLLTNLLNKFQLKDGHFVTRITTLKTLHKVPYHRWPQAQVFHALTTIMRYI